MNFNILLTKLSSIGLNDRFLKLFKSYSFGGTQRVRIDGYLSATVDITSGVPQGSVLGPLLFLLFIDDKLSLPENSTCYCFADNTKLSSSGYDAFVNCQNDLSLLFKWCAKKHLNFNISKFAFICFRPECSGTLFLDGHLWKRLDATSDLGLEVSSKLKWDLHLRAKLCRARDNFNYLRHNAQYSLPSIVELILYYARALSTFLYGSQVWSPDVSQILLMEKFQLKCLSWCFGRTDYLSPLRRANCLPISYHLIESHLHFFSN